MQMSTKTLYRSLLRAVDQHFTSVAGNTQWRAFLLSQFRVRTSDASHRAKVAEDYAFLLSNIAHHQASRLPIQETTAACWTSCFACAQSLLVRYNIGVDSEDRNKAMVAAVAKRVGFKLPSQQ
ncbi:hypothetical protein QJQ45_016260 [Haematococcus lacustris]|nr:hypothetical protein QJQ45_016260 [Haematococcus lacustris]